MRFLKTCCIVISIFMAGTMISIACFQHFAPKASIIISCEDPVDEDGSNVFEDDKEHTSHIITLINPPASQDPIHFYHDLESIHSQEITVPPPEV